MPPGTPDVDVTPEHLVVALMRRVVDRLDGHETGAVYLPEYTEPINHDEYVGIAAVALCLAVAAMQEAVEYADVEVTLDEVLTRCSLRVLAAAGASQ
jgi:hypothetical protein